MRKVKNLLGKFRKFKKMAAEGQVEEFCSESARLREEIVRLISRKLEESIPKKSKCLKIAKILSKRKRKWRKKHNLEAVKLGEMSYLQESTSGLKQLITNPLQHIGLWITSLDKKKRRRKTHRLDSKMSSFVEGKKPLGSQGSRRERKGDTTWRQ